MKLHIVITTLMLANTLFIQSNKATNKIWEGDVNHDWNNPANWSENTTPSNEDDIIINPNYYSLEPTILSNSSFIPRDINLFNGAKFIINANLNISGNINITDSCFLKLESGEINILSTNSLNISNDAKCLISGTTTFIVGNINLNGASMFVYDNANINISNKLYIACENTQYLNGLFYLDKGTVITGCVELDGNGSSGTYNASLIMNNGTFTNKGGLTFIKSTNTGCFINILGGEFFQEGEIKDGSEIYDGVINIQLSGSSTTTFNGNITLETTDSLIQKEANSTYFKNTITIYNSGSFNSFGGTIYFNGLTTLTGTGSYTFNNVNICTGKTLNQSGSPLLNIMGNWTNNEGYFIYNTNTLNFNGNSNQEINGSASLHSFYNITINKSAGTLTFGGSTNSATTNNFELGSANKAMVYAPTELNLIQSTTASLILNSGNSGSLTAGELTTIRGNWTNNCGSEYYIPNGGLVVFKEGAVQQINGTSATHTFYNIEINKTNQSVSISGSAKQLNVNNFTQTAYRFNASALNTFSVSGNFLHNSGTFNPCNNIYIGGNITDNHAYEGITWGNNVTLNGTKCQIIGGLYPLTFKTLTINNENDTGIWLQQPLTIRTTLNLAKGIINTDNTNMLIMKDNSTSTAGSSTSFVNGPMKKIGNDPFLFPVGYSGKYAPLEMVNDANFQNYGTTTEFTCIYHDYAPPNNNNPEYLEAGIKYASHAEYWNLERTYDVGNNAQCNVRLYFTDITTSGIIDDSLTNLKLVHLSSAYSFYRNHGGTASVNGQDGYITSTIPLTDFSPITFGAIEAVSPLPIELLSFEASITPDNKIKLTWEVASEINNDYYTIERSENGMIFSPVAIVNGAGTSMHTLQYSIIDDFPLLGANYYRLIQTDLDGKKTFHKIIYIENTTEREKYLFYPNPLHPNSDPTLQIDLCSNKFLDISIINTQGNIIYSKSIELKKGSNLIKPKEITNNLSAGNYSIIITNNGNSYIEKLIVK